MDKINRLIEIEDQRVALEKEAIEINVSLKPLLSSTAYGQLCCLSFMPNNKHGKSQRKNARNYFLNEYQEKPTPMSMPGMTPMPGMMPGMN